MVDPVAVPVAPGWTPTATVSAINGLITVVLGGGGLWGLFRAIALLWRIYNQRAEQDALKDAAFRKELAEQNDRLTARIEKLEGEVSAERRRCDEEVLALRRQHAEEVQGLRQQVEAMQRIIIQWQVSTGAMIGVPASAVPSSMTRFAEQLDAVRGVGEPEPPTS